MRLTFTALIIISIFILGTIGLAYSYIADAKNNALLTAKFEKSDSFPKLIKITPDLNTTSDLSQSFEFEFDRPILPDSIKIVCFPEAKIAISQTKSIAGPTHLIISPLSKLADKKNYTFKILPGSNIDKSRNLQEEYTLKFRTDTSYK